MTWRGASDGFCVAKRQSTKKLAPATEGVHRHRLPAHERDKRGRMDGRRMETGGIVAAAKSLPLPRCMPESLTGHVVGGLAFWQRLRCLLGPALVAPVLQPGPSDTRQHGHILPCHKLVWVAAGLAPKLGSNIIVR